MNKKSFSLLMTLIVLLVTFTIYNSNNVHLPIVSIVNYGPHSSLNATITGLKEQMTKEGFIEGENIKYEIADVGFDTALIAQMISSLKSKNPQIMVALTTPVAMAAKAKIHNIPLIYSAITDPVEAGLIQEHNKPYNNITGSSDMQDLYSFLLFAKTILPNAKKIGLLYATSESNDMALVNMMRLNASKLDMELLAIPVEQARDVAMRMQEFKDKADLIYVGTSGPIQPTLPTIAAEARKMHIPVFNVDTQAVKDGIALASFGVDYLAVGKNTGKLVASILQGKSVKDLPPIYPNINDHHGIINKKLAEELGLTIPANIEIVE